MKGFFSLFVKSARELRNVRSLTVTGIFIAIYTVIEFYSIDLQFVKINFAFLAIAVIGMLFGPTMGMFSGFICDIAGYLVHPSGGFLPLYVLACGLQGMIYGLCLYVKADNYSIVFVNNLTKKQVDITLYLRAVLARLIDVIVINLLINTKLNIHYGFIPYEAYGTAIISRIAKNVIELAADIPLLFVLLPVALTTYKKIASAKRAAGFR